PRAYGQPGRIHGTLDGGGEEAPRGRPIEGQRTPPRGHRPRHARGDAGAVPGTPGVRDGRVALKVPGEAAMSPFRSCWLGTLVLALLPLRATACPERPTGMDEKGKMSLKLPRRPGDREAIRAMIEVGPLPSGARLIVRSPDGKIAATITPFGV